MKNAIRILLPFVVLALAACGQSGDLVDGTYTGTGAGYYGDVVVEVTVDRGRVSNVAIVEAEETRAMLEAVTENLLPQIVEQQSTNGVDTVTGATSTSNAVIDAAGSAIDDAEGES